MKKSLVVLSGIMFLLVISLATAGLFSGITGKATSQQTNVTVQVAGVNASKVVNISIPANVNPTEDTSTPVSVLVTLYDSDGVADINDSSVQVIFTKPGETSRENLT